jgi:PhnB protein
MSRSLATYIALPGNTAEAMEHWRDVFGGQLDILRYADTSMEDLPFEPDPQAVAHATLTMPVGIIAGGDTVDDGQDYPLQGTAYSLLYTTSTPDEARGYVEQLVDAGGSVGMPFEQAPWGDWYGQVFDRFGVMWAFACDDE